MKPYLHIRKADGYCCRWCDGPYNVWKNKFKKNLKKKDKTRVKKDISRQLSDTD